MKRILHCLNSLSYGGVETAIMNIYRNIDHSQYHFDFLLRVPRNANNDALICEIEKTGGRIYETAQFPRHMIRNAIEVEHFLEEHLGEYEAVHIHANSFLYITPLLLAKRCGIPVRVVHSHSTGTLNKIYRATHYINRQLFAHCANRRIACSDAAGQWMFGNYSSETIRNCIDLNCFRYNETVRMELRKKLKLEGRTIIGHAGNFAPAKNCGLVLSVFEKYTELDSSALLVFAGTGTLQGEIEKEVRQRKLTDKVIFLGFRTDMHDVYQLFDLFFMPSLYEGLPYALVEAQAAGLPCLISDAITEDSIATENVARCGLSDPPEVWAQKMERMLQSFQRKDTYEVMKNKGWDISTEVQELEKIYQI